MTMSCDFRVIYIYIVCVHVTSCDDLSFVIVFLLSNKTHDMNHFYLM